MKHKRLLAIISALGLLVVACASRPSEDELTSAILKATSTNPAVPLTEGQARCIALNLLGSDLSDTTLAGLAKDFVNPEVLDTEAAGLNARVREAATACA